MHFYNYLGNCIILRENRKCAREGKKWHQHEEIGEDSLRLHEYQLQLQIKNQR